MKFQSTLTLLVFLDLQSIRSNVNQMRVDALSLLLSADEEWLIMERNTDYQLEHLIFEIVVWLFVIAVVFVDIKVTFF